MSTISLRLPESLHARVRELAKKECVSINHLITLAVAEKLSVLDAAAYFAERAKRGSRERFLEALSRVPDVEPEEYDRL